jgi:hypothetical protein
MAIAHSGIFRTGATAIAVNMVLSKYATAKGIFSLGESFAGRREPYQTPIIKPTISIAQPAAKIRKPKTCSGVRVIGGWPNRSGIQSQ